MAERLHGRLRERLGGQAPPAEALAPGLALLLEQARSAHPGLRLSDEDFVDHIAAVLPDDSPADQALASLRADDLFLARACAGGDSAAIAAFEAACGEAVRRALARSQKQSPQDFWQALRERLFAGPSPRVLAYGGQGALRAWVQVAALRLLVDLSRKRGEVLLPDEFGPPPAPDPGDDPELAYLKSLYGHAFKRAFEEAVMALTPEERNLLRAHYAHGLSVDQLGALFQVHRSTAARQLVRAREALLEGTREALRARLRLGPDELQSVLRLIESQMHLSLRRVLGEG